MTRLNISHEVVDTPGKARQIAYAQSNQVKYKYKANALLSGYPNLRPYDPVYLTGLTDGMSGVWVVLSVTHVFNTTLPYTMKVLVGSTDALLALAPPKDAAQMYEVIPEIPTISEDATFLSINADPRVKKAISIASSVATYALQERLPISVPDDMNEVATLSFPKNPSYLLPNPAETWAKNQEDHTLDCSCHNGLYGLYTPVLPKTNTYTWKELK